MRVLNFPALVLVVAMAGAIAPLHAQVDEGAEAALRAQLEARMERAREAAERATRAPASPRIENLPVPVTPEVPVDIHALAERYAEAGAPAAVERPTLLAMVSLSIPRASLQRLIADAERTGATLVMRGLANGSIRETMRIAMELIGERQVAWTIDPELFPRFGVEAVPAYVLLPAGVSARECGGTVCFGEDSYVRLAGDVPIDYALEKMELAAPEFAAAARHFRSTSR